MISGYDISGIKHDKDGDLNDLWHDDDESYVKNKSECFAKQYENYKNPDLPTLIKFDGTRQMEEIFADNIGLLLAFRAYETLVKEQGEEKKLPGLGLNPRQLFFLAYAQTWCSKVTSEFTKRMLKKHKNVVGRFRIVGTLRNSPEFAKAFNCSFGSPMNPKKKCSRVFGREE
ncbi:endothelin-converting enzyme 1 [Elysia marginata]|uniref:Endothelin-converting enzyme 1 n=1 Tax=Elysia marginata TaxID=1093978 RepID=A0AAV4GQD8_9GAST|nr:endothelin-converting enzyme 1 [Elysia marginata]